MKIEGKTAFVMALFVVAVFMLASKFMLPTSIQVIIEGQSTYVKEIPNVYTALDCVIIAIASFMLGASVFYLLFVGFRMPEKERIEREAEQKEAGLESALQVQDAHIPNVDAQVPETSRAAPEDDRAGLLKILKGNEKMVIEALMDYGEMNQADMSARTGIPKSTLSRILQDLEDRSLIFRYDYGMSKMVKLA
ncbi:MAG: MarR family transcriptional regulator [Methanophagales archaeon]|nr:MarR family transcriptional regulator [Methanophagales archaeon]